ncbi:hypothetical protein A3B32_02925 [Candidatus Uhrbacteria bacterium RIFCSPLOWO2_01_FULL_53_9]|uniref:Uncharacterized protein n=2 Tax=Candidatus Uhriibacteriota TaxID=1752732 RepID=A0A1F7UYP2_9BACT|nr:MAG: hypothetical protein A3C17_04305 [Candidatus Uhrbacteria bacterium RIFCSPHIGHO2_02_FULL_53_13]OGL83356.1 MAG: hypothetical protein A3B32_02925 [Candidatus Uhrbacteria bacterium RIFCSPLOWO2_01_FULL_53_9]
MKQRRNKNKRLPGPVLAPSWPRTLSLIVIVLMSIGCLSFFVKVEQTKSAHSIRVSAPSQVSVPVHAVLTVAEIFRQMLIEHPATEISGDLYRMIENGQMIWETRASNGHFAEFWILPQNKTGAAHSAPMSVLTIDPRLLYPENLAMAQLVLYHEYQHVLQWQTGEIEEDTFRIHLRDEKNPAHLCEQRRQAEVSAYRNECAFARRVGLTNVLPICALTNAAELEAAIVEKLASDVNLGALCR